MDSSGSHKMSPNGPQTLSAHDVLGSHSLGIEMEHLAEMDESRPYAAAALSAERSRPALRLCARAKTESTYERHVERQREEVEELRRDLRTELRLPSMDARDMEGEAALAALSAEEREKLAEARPPSLAAAARIQVEGQSPMTKAVAVSEIVSQAGIFLLVIRPNFTVVNLYNV